MKNAMTAPSKVERRVESEATSPLPRGLSDLAAWLFSVNADRWRRRAQFYERHRDYFPRLASSPFVDRCRELEAASRAFAHRVLAVPPQDHLVPVRVTVSRLTSLRIR